MEGQRDGHPVTGSYSDFQQAMVGWEQAVSDFETSFERINWAIDYYSAYAQEIIQLRDQAIEKLAQLQDESLNAFESPERATAELLAHTKVLVRYNQQVTVLLNRLANSKGH
jgi:hypothetical protein